MFIEILLNIRQLISLTMLQNFYVRSIYVTKVETSIYNPNR